MCVNLSDKIEEQVVLTTSEVPKRMMNRVERPARNLAMQMHFLPVTFLQIRVETTREDYSEPRLLRN